MFAGFLLGAVFTLVFVVGVGMWVNKKDYGKYFPSAAERLAIDNSYTKSAGIDDSGFAAKPGDKY